MKIKYLFICSLFLAYSLGFSQTLPNMDFEDWSSYGSYEEPSGGVWTTANKTTLLTALIPVTTEKTTDAFSGTYAAKMSTKLAPLIPNPLLITGTLATGTFNELAVPPDNLQMGTPFTGRPLRFTGYYKYIDNAGDSCDIYAVLSKWNGTTRQIVGEARMRSTLTVLTYTKFELNFIYSLPDTPDSISVVFASSAAGDQMIGHAGSALFIDNISLEYTNDIFDFSENQINVSCYPGPYDDFVNFKINNALNNGNIAIYNLIGAEIKSLSNLHSTEFSISVDDLKSGCYYYRISDKGSFLASGGFFVK